MIEGEFELAPTGEVSLVVPIAAHVSIGVHERNLWVGARMLAAATAFLFLPFIFGYLYLGSLNTSGMWRPHHMTAPIGWGLAIVASLLASAGLLAVARQALAHQRVRGAWQASLASLVLGLAAVVLQGAEFEELPFEPTDGGYASVFIGWTGAFALLVLATMVWLEIVVAGIVSRRATPALINASELDAVGFFTAFVAGLGVVTFTFLYLL